MPQSISMLMSSTKPLLLENLMYSSLMAVDFILRAVCFLSSVRGGGGKHLLGKLTSTPGKKKNHLNYQGPLCVLTPMQVKLLSSLSVSRIKVLFPSANGSSSAFCCQVIHVNYILLEYTQVISSNFSYFCCRML